MAGNRDEAIRTRAHAIWDAEGVPAGRTRRHWEHAARDIDEAQAEAAVSRETGAR
ncbi:DUF2934 domain-containing protein [Sphingomonas sp.]|uniref:DUF2934 domain-containing protein n=1 Tax=Sphingomonas sp. TaxID=28214 RepID=UPI003CC6AE67